MYKLRVDAMGVKDARVIYGETKEEVVAKMLQYLETRHSTYVGQTTIQRLAELEAIMMDHIVEE